MPRTTAFPPASRFFARLDRFECECPNCGQVISTDDNTGMPRRLYTLSGRRSAAKIMPHNQSVQLMVWNALTQRLRCPHCKVVYMAGLLLYSIKPGTHPPVGAPFDAIPTARQRVEMRRKSAGGWWAEQLHEDEVNLAVEALCTCPDRGTSRFCPVHGWEQPVEGVNS